MAASSEATTENDPKVFAELAVAPQLSTMSRMVVELVSSLFATPTTYFSLGVRPWTILVHEAFSAKCSKEHIEPVIAFEFVSATKLSTVYVFAPMSLASADVTTADMMSGSAPPVSVRVYLIHVSSVPSSDFANVKGVTVPDASYILVKVKELEEG